jgi:hypothetical protein
LESRIINNDVSLFRSVIYLVDTRFRPLDCHMVLHKDGTQLRSAWVTVNGNHLSAMADTMGARITHEVDVPDEFSWSAMPARQTVGTTGISMRRLLKETRSMAAFT